MAITTLPGKRVLRYQLSNAVNEDGTYTDGGWYICEEEEKATLMLSMSATYYFIWSVVARHVLLFFSFPGRKENKVQEVTLSLIHIELTSGYLEKLSI